MAIRRGPIVAGSFVWFGLFACGSTDGPGSKQTGLGSGGGQPFGGMSAGTGGSAPVSTTGGTSSIPGSGGTPGVNPTTGGTAPIGGMPGGGVPPTAGATGSGGTNPMGGSAGQPGAAGGGGTAGSAGVGGGGGAPPGMPLTAKCNVDTLLPPLPGTGLGKACSSFVTPTSDGKGILTEFGPYGAMVEGNTGKAFAVTPSASEGSCTAIAGSFGEDPNLTKDVLNLHGADLSLYTVFRPANWVDGEKYPIITWGNGTCAYPGSYSAVLAHVASHGFVVVASNGRFVANGAQKKGLDFMFAANEDSASPYYHRLDTTNVGAMGHSQGSGATVTVASDPRVKYVILFNGGTTAPKPFLAISGDKDIGNPTVASYRSGVNAAPKAAFIFYHKILQTTGSVTGHLVLMMQPDRVVDATTGWWKYTLKGDMGAARDLFVGDSCGLCGKAADFDYGQHGLN
jgi:hypothetical protein